MVIWIMEMDMGAHIAHRVYTEVSYIRHATSKYEVPFDRGIAVNASEPHTVQLF